MDLLIEQHLKDPKQFTELDIREEVDTFMFEGHDTTAMSLIWTLHLLGNHPDIQNRVHKEIDEIRQQSDDDDDQTTQNWSQNQLRQMKFLEACIKESLRIYPSVPVISRYTHQDTEIEPGRIIPKGTSVALVLYMIQRDPKYFQQPERYIPGRFIEDSEHYCGRMNPFAYVPFSAGPRNCIGQKFALQEEKIMLATLLSRYRVESGDNCGNVDVKAALILRPKSSVNIRFIQLFMSIIIQRWLRSKSMISKFHGINVPFWKILIGNIDMLFIESWATEKIVDNYFKLMTGMSKIFGETSHIWFSLFPTMVISHADVAEKILSSTNTFLDKDNFYEMLKPWLNEGLLTSASNKWRSRRKLLTPTFHFNILEQFLPIMNEQAQILSRIINDRQLKAGGNGYLDIVPLITNATLDVISETAMGVKIGSQLDNNRDYVDAVTRVSATTLKRMLLPWLQNNFIYFNFLAEGRKHRRDINLVREFTMNVIKERKNEIIRKQFTELDIREEVDTFMVAGHDTTAVSLIWTLHLLGNHPDIQYRVHKEIDEIRQQSDDDDDQTTQNWSQNQLRQMKFLEACIKESLRIYPSGTVISRYTHQDTEIEPGRIQNISQQPERYIPGRFIEDSEHYCGRMNPFAYVPFSAGPRNCIGQKFALQEEKITLATLLSRYRVESGDYLGNVHIKAALILRPKSSVNIRFIQHDLIPNLSAIPVSIPSTSHVSNNNFSSTIQHQPAVSNLSLNVYPTSVRASDLLTFDGNVINWIPFKTSFDDEVLSNPNLLDTKKRNLLLKVLHGSALDRAMDLVRQGKTLQSIWSSLNDYYNSPSKIDEHLTKQIRSLAFVNSPFESAKLEIMLREIRRLSSTCVSLGAAYLARSNSLVKEILWKCGRPLREKLCHVESLSQLEKELEKLYKSALCLDSFDRRESARPSRSSHPVAAMSVARCVFCNRSNHQSADCQSSISVDEKRRIINSNSLCFKCLSPGHRASTCSRAASIRCRVCRLSHPTVLHQVRLNNHSNSSNNNNSVHPSTSVSSSPSVAASSTSASIATSVPSTSSSTSGVAAISVLSNSSDLSLIPSSSSSSIPSSPSPMVSLSSSNSLAYVSSSESSSVAGISSSSENSLVARYDGVASPSITIERPAFVINLCGRKCMVWLDTCSPFTLIRSDLVNMNDCVSAPSICLSGFSGGSATITNKKISVILESNVTRVSIDAYVITNLHHCDLIIGTDMLSRITPLSLLNKLVARLQSRNFYDVYRDEFMKYVSSGQAVEINDTDGFFIPHHAVLRSESSSSPIRIVFNASFGRESSLNNLLWKGSVMGLDVLPHLIRIRLFKYFCTADLRKAFLQIAIYPEHQKYLRLLWKENDNQIKKYQMTVLPFGVISSPAILTQVVDKIVQSISNESSRNLLSGVTYMDDLLIGSNSIDDLRQCVIDAKQAFSASGFEMHKICSNGMIPDGSTGDDSGLLGLLWNMSEDTISLKNRDLVSPSLTKRIVLSTIGRIFDPLGIIDPLKLRLRIMFSCIVSNEWDTPIVDDDFVREWNKAITDWPNLDQIKFNRFIPDTSIMYCFADASEVGLGYCIYLGSQFLFGKSKVASKTKTIVEKELLALLELVKMVYRIRKILLQSQVNPSIRIFSDSKINLDRLNASPNRFKCHLGKKLLRILQIISDCRASVIYISGNLNPADLFSRPISVSKFLQQKPWFLQTTILPNESCPIVSVCAIKKEEIDPTFINFLNRFSSIKSMLRWINRFRSWLPKHKQDRMIDSLFILIRCFQANSPFVSSHDHFIDDRGLIVYRMRDGVNSIWIPPRTALSRALLYEAHRLAKHNGVKLSLAQIPVELAIGDANRSMARLIYRCVLCRKRRGKGISVPFGPTYHEVDVFSGPFARIAIDGFGPFKLLNGRKYWGLIVACLSTRCLRIGVLEDLTPISAGRALKSIFHEVGFPKFIISDNGTNFKPIKLALEKAKMSVVWWTTAPSAPWQNGTAERFVQMVKSCLSIYDKKCRSFYDVMLRFREVESIINARPIIANDRPISAFEFCFQRPFHIIPEKTDFKPIDLDRLYRFNLDLKKRFVKLLRLRYFNLYRFRPKTKSVSINVGDFVLIPDKSHRELWPTGRILELSMGRDGLARSARIEFGGSSLWRPVSATNETNIETFAHQIILLFIRYAIISIIVSLLLLRSIRIMLRWLRAKSMICKFPFWKIQIGNIDMLLIESWTTETIVDSKKKNIINIMSLIIKITKASRRQIALSLDELLNLQKDYDNISAVCLESNPEDFDEQKAKDDLYKQQIEALISCERSVNQLEAITIDDDELIPDLSSIQRNNNLSSTIHQPTTSSIHQPPSTSSNLLMNVYPATVRASDLLTFDGNVINWLPFKMSFEDEVINNPNLMESKKRNLLLKVLQGNALDRAMDLVRQGKTLQSIWSSLNVYYNSPSKIDEHLTKQIRSLAFVNSPFESAKLEIMLREIRRLSSTCVSLGAAYLARSNSLVKEILWKCGRPLREKLCHVESLSQLEKELEKLYKSALCLDSFDRRESARPSRSSHPVAAMSVARCVFCNRSNHQSADCQSSISVDEKRRIINSNSLCFKCLSFGHRASTCSRAASIRCRVCRLSHPTVLHQVRLNNHSNSSNNNNYVHPSTSVSSSPSVAATSTSASTSASVPSTSSSTSGVAAISVLSNSSDLSMIPSSSSFSISSSPSPMVSLSSSNSLAYVSSSESSSVAGISSSSENSLVARYDGVASPSTTIERPAFVINLCGRKCMVWLDTCSPFTLIRSDLVNMNDCVSAPSICLSGFSGGSATITNKKISVILESNVTRVSIDAYVIANLHHCDLIIGTDMLPPLSLLNKLIARLQAQNSYDLYRCEFMKFVSSGQAIEVDEIDGFFIPHHAVFRPESTSSPVRIVFNASFGRESSLNSLLWKGSVIGLDVLPHLIRIRLFKYFCTADLRKAFLQVSIYPDHRKYLRLLWKENDNQIKKYQMTVLPFGVISSPAILTQVVDKIVQSISNESSRNLLSGVTYMDDLLIGSNSIDDLRQCVIDAKQAFSAAGFEMHKICSNGMIPGGSTGDDSGLLGLVWNMSEDAISLKNRDLVSPSLTKRIVLSTIGRIFDPLGIIDPLKLRLRIMFSCIVSNEWDTPIVDDDFVREWNKAITDWPNLDQIKFNRFIPDTSIMYCFADASEVGLGYCIYLGSQFLFGKSKVASKTKTIVEKELMALYELVKMVCRVRKMLLQSQVIPSIRIFSDSKINLDRLNASPNRFKCHLGKKLLHILQIISDCRASVIYISGNLNPADLFSRPISVLKYMQHKPWFLQTSILPNESCPIVSVCAIEREDCDLDLKNFLNRLSSIEKMIRWIERFRRWLPKHRQLEMIDSRFLLFRCFQMGERFKSPHDHFKDGRGLIVYRMRDGINSVWIPPRSALAHALLLNAHRSAKHNGLKMSLAQIPPEIIIGNANRTMARLIYQCLICRSRRGKSISVPFGPSYHEVDIFSGPFSRIAIDGFGPFELKNGKKFWGLVVVCLSTRCLRIGVLENLTPIAAARALNSVFHEVGYPKFILSDNGTNFRPIKAALEKSGMSVVWWSTTPLAPWQNGSAERFVKMIKSCLSIYNKKCRSLYVAILRFREVESIVNAMPILAGERPISAHEFCFHRPLHVIPEKVSEFKPIDLDRLYRFNLDLKKRFTKLLKLRYYNLYRFRPKTQSSSIKIGDYVLVPDRTKREIWPTGQIRELAFGRDGFVRSARIDFLGFSLWRPVSGLIPIARAEDC
ncbi:Cytochrome P450 4V2, variant 2 [Dermatophagoides farinae]|uniref:Cytochrome P450 4V2, variant 2 n=1 Tax=Dermatophagoides farinae TaxID=6954 RepID=A0A922I1B1_DERFA|nr:Cytochrome P450 4V2, variant 2 [Dermatophagoides farinae]